MAHYVKLFDSIIHSTIWQEEAHVKIVWITMLALTDAHGEVHASIPGLAKAAGVSLTQCEDALKVLLSPDPYSRSKDFDGRRIETIDGGWELLNYKKYRELKSQEQERENAAIRQQRARDRKKIVTEVVTPVTESHTESRQVEVEVKEKNNTPLPPASGGGVSKAARKAAKLQGLPEEAKPFFSFAWDTFPTDYLNADKKVRNLRLGEVQVVKLWKAILGGAFAGMLRDGEPATAEELASAAQFYILAPHPQVAKGYASEIGVFYSISEKVDSKNLWAEAVNKIRDLRKAGKIEPPRPWDGEPPMRSVRHKPTPEPLPFEPTTATA